MSQHKQSYMAEYDLKTMSRDSGQLLNNLNKDARIPCPEISIAPIIITINIIFFVFVLKNLSIQLLYISFINNKSYTAYYLQKIYVV